MPEQQQEPPPPSAMRLQAGIEETCGVPIYFDLDAALANVNIVHNELQTLNAEGCLPNQFRTTQGTSSDFHIPDTFLFESSAPTSLETDTGINSGNVEYLSASANDPLGYLMAH